MQWKNEARTEMLLGHPFFRFHCACQAQPVSVSANNAPCCRTACSSPPAQELKQNLLGASRDIKQPPPGFYREAKAAWRQCHQMHTSGHWQGSQMAEEDATSCI